MAPGGRLRGERHDTARGRRESMNHDTKTEVHKAIARDAYKASLDRFELVADVVRACVARESMCRGYDPERGERDPVADECAEVALHAFGILTERAGMTPHGTIAGDAARVASAQNFLRNIRQATDRLAAMFPGGAE